jgi:hypothetical protein
MMISIQRHEFCDRKIGYVFLSLPVIFCGLLAMAVQGMCRGVQKKAWLGRYAMLGLMLTVLLSFIYVGVC